MSPKQQRVPWTSSITTVEAGTLTTRGIDQLEIIRDFDQTEALFLLLKGHRPTPAQKNVLRALIVAHLSHGITGQSTLAVMEAADCRSEFLPALVAGFCVGAGVYHQGGLAAAMRELQAFSALTPAQMETEVGRRLDRRDVIIGYGHRFHCQDPRAALLIEIAEAERVSGPYVRTALVLEELLARKKNIRMNVEAAGAAILLDLGFDPRIAHLFIVLGRSPMYAAVYLERLQNSPRPFPPIEVADLIQVTS